MSADDGIYILITNAPPIKNGACYTNQHGKKEFRVAHCQAIENIDYSDLYLPIYFGRSQIFSSLKEAKDFANKLEELRAKNNFGMGTEYGINTINLEKVFPNLSPETAKKAVDCYVGSIPA